MKKFLSEVVVFSGLLIGLLLLVKAFLPFYWGNNLLAHKFAEIKHSNSKIQDYFIGSSVTYRHINPDLIEEITGRSSFNLGSPGTYALETEFILENFIKSMGDFENSNFYIQKSKLDPIRTKVRHSTRAKYFLDFKRTCIGVKYFWSRSNFKQVYFHISGFIENKLCIGQFADIYSFYTSGPKPISDTVLNQKGFYALDHEADENNDIKLKVRNRRFVRKAKAKAKKLKERENQKKNKPRKRKKQQTKSTNNVTLSKMDWGELNIQCKSKNIFQIKGKLFFTLDYYFDSSHYNSSGADMFSTAVAKRILNSK